MKEWYFILWIIVFIFLHKRIALLMMKKNEEWGFLSCMGMILPSFIIYTAITITSPVWVPSYLLYKTVWK